MVFKATNPIRRKTKMPVKKGYKSDYKKVMTQIRELSRQSKYDKTTWSIYNSLNQLSRDSHRYDLKDDYVLDVHVNSENKGVFCWLFRKYIKYTHFDRTRVKKYHEMKRYESFDAFLTEHIKNSICEDNLGDILSFL